MRSWTLESFEHNNRKLNHYLRNIDNAIVLLCANDRRAMTELQKMLQDEFAFEGIDYSGIKQPFPALLNTYEAKEKQNKLCFYNLPEDSEEYDLLKTMNMSRDLLRKVGIVVFIIPAFLMAKIQLETPNLYDYVTLCLNYNVIYKTHLEPIYSEERRYFIPRKTRTARKAAILANKPEQIQTIKEYYNYLEACQYVHVTQEDVYFMIGWLFDYLQESLAVRNSELENLLDEKPQDFSEIRMDLYVKTAMVFLQHGFLDDAIRLYNEVLYIKKWKQKHLPSDKSSILELEAIQGTAYCYYRMGEYAQAQNILTILIKEVESIGNLTWKYKIYNDLGVCYYKQNQLHDAVAIWKECEVGLRKLGEYNIYRHFRILYNRMLASLEGEHIFSKHEEEWKKLGKRICRDFSENGLEYYEYLLLSSWMYFKDGRLELAWDCAVNTHQAGDAILPDNDEKRIWIEYLLALIALQQGRFNGYEFFLRRCKNLLKNHRERMPDYQDIFCE